ncbi:hypothetical protein Z043_119231 [Scleropages formosus]|uniref:MORN repeat-containing protein 4-like n=1 Tax=Scleropages formosus TaxID=113540 RepID=A0A0P7TNA2_SCLFO|nr:hypothetical protein Z043_119231 [Scleropages formosus]
MDGPVLDMPAPECVAAGAPRTPWTPGSSGSYAGETGVGGQKHGSGLQMWPDGSRYEGQFTNGHKEGVGVYTWPDGEVGMSV